MASSKLIPDADAKRTNVLRYEMEELLFDFYSVVGVASPRPYALIPENLLADDFEGRFFIATALELHCYNKAKMLATKVGTFEVQKPSCELLNLSVTSKGTDAISVVYAAAFRHGQSITMRRGTFQAVRVQNRWALQSIDEDIRVILLPSVPRRPLSGADRPRVWFI